MVTAWLSVHALPVPSKASLLPRDREQDIILTARWRSKGSWVLSVDLEPYNFTDVCVQGERGPFRYSI